MRRLVGYKGVKFNLLFLVYKVDNTRRIKPEGRLFQKGVRGSLRTWHVHMDVASPPSLAPQLNIFVIQHSFASP